MFFLLEKTSVTLTLYIYFRTEIDGKTAAPVVLQWKFSIFLKKGPLANAKMFENLKPK